MITKIKNEFSLIGFCASIGLATSLIIWLFLRVMELGIEFIWEYIPSRIDFAFYTIPVCILGATIIGLLHKKIGNYPEDLETILGKIKKDNYYPYKNIKGMLILALLPLIFGSSIGPEAGMTGVIVGLCYWAGDNLKFAYENTRRYSQVGEAVTFGLLFHAPLFGIFSALEEGEAYEEDLSKGSKVFVYGLTIASGTGGYLLLTYFFGGGMGLPSFSKVDTLVWQDYAMLIVYIIAGCVLAYFYEITHHYMSKIMKRIPIILREITGGIILGVLGLFFPIVMFSGEKQMAELMTDYVNYIPIFLIGIAFLKVLLTNICIQSGLVGGHFFPLIFAGVSLGYGVSCLVFGIESGHEIFAVAAVTGALLGTVMKKPLAVTGLLLICFPIQLSIWIFVAACIGSRLSTKKESATA